MREYLKDLRKQAGLKQVEVAEKLGVTQAYIAQLENGRTRQISVNLADNLATIYGVNIKQIVLGENQYAVNHR